MYRHAANADIRAFCQPRRTAPYTRKIGLSMTVALTHPVRWLVVVVVADGSHSGHDHGHVYGHDLLRLSRGSGCILASRGHLRRACGVTQPCETTHMRVHPVRFGFPSASHLDDNVPRLLA
jgi:hypothetical protein